MAVKRLGKGLGALIPQMTPDDSHRQERLRDVPVSKVMPNPFQPRESFDPVALEELKQSIAENGVIQPISVREVDSGYELIAGERRLRAVQALGLDSVPAYIMEVNSDREMMELSLIENIQREDLNPIDEANGYQALMTKCELTQDEVARKVGKDRSTITNCLRLLKLPRVIQESLAKGEITPGHARAFLALEEKSAQIELWKRAVNGGYSVRQVEKLAKSGNPSSPPRKKRVETNPDPFLRETEDKLRGVLGTQVRINETKKGEVGRIEIEYYSSTDLERILDLILELE